MPSPVFVAPSAFSPLILLTICDFSILALKKGLPVAVLLIYFALSENGTIDISKFG